MTAASRGEGAQQRPDSRRSCKNCKGPVASWNTTGYCSKNTSCRTIQRRIHKRVENFGTAKLLCIRCRKPIGKSSDKRTRNLCNACQREGKRKSRDRAHSYFVGTQYGLLPGEYQKIYAYQGNHCAICLRATGKTKRLSVDHDHKIGLKKREAVRGLLCTLCNRMLGHARDDPEFFERAIAYLRNPPAYEVLI